MVSPELLRRFACFSGASEQALKQVAMIGEERTAPRGSILFHEGQDATHLCILVEGEVEIQYVLGDGSYQTVDTLIAGDFMLWSSLVEPHTTHSRGVARTPVKVVAIHARKLCDLLESEPMLGYNVMKSVAAAISHRLHGARLQIAAM